MQSFVRLPVLLLFAALTTLTAFSHFFGPLLSSYNGQTVDTNSRTNLVTPRTLAQLQKAVVDGVTQGKQIRIAGASHSTSSILLSDSSYYIKTTWLNAIGPVETIGGRHFVTVGGGARLGDVSDALAAQGYSLGFAFPAYRGLTIAGLIATGSHGSSRRHPAISAQTVESVEIVVADGSILKVDRSNSNLFRAANVSLGMLGVVYSVRLRIEPQFNLRVQTSVLDLTQDSLSDFVRAKPTEDYLSILWFPNQKKAIVESGVKTADPSDPGAENMNLGLDVGVGESSHQAGEFFAKGRADTTGKTDAAIEAKRVAGLTAQPRFAFQKAGFDVPSINVVGPSNKMLLSRGEELVWAYTLTDHSFSFPVSKAADVFQAIENFAKEKNYSFPIAGIVLRFAHSDGGQSSFLSHIENGSSQELWVLAEFLEYKPRDVFPVVRVPRDDVRDEFLAMLRDEQGVRFHWGKNSDTLLSANMKHPFNATAISDFLKVAAEVDPNCVFTSKFMKDLFADNGFGSRVCP